MYTINSRSLQEVRDLRVGARPDTMTVIMGSPGTLPTLACYESLLLRGA